MLIVRQSAKQEKIWDAAKAGDKVLLQHYVTGASAGDFEFEKEDEVRYRVNGSSQSFMVWDHSAESYTGVCVDRIGGAPRWGYYQRWAAPRWSPCWSKPELMPTTRMDR
jgi:hypothetical protein